MRGGAAGIAEGPSGWRPPPCGGGGPRDRAQTMCEEPFSGYRARGPQEVQSARNRSSSMVTTPTKEDFGRRRSSSMLSMPRREDFGSALRPPRHEDHRRPQPGASRCSSRCTDGFSSRCGSRIAEDGYGGGVWGAGRWGDGLGGPRCAPEEGGSWPGSPAGPNSERARRPPPWGPSNGLSSWGAEDFGSLSPQRRGPRSCASPAAWELDDYGPHDGQWLAQDSPERHDQGDVGRSPHGTVSGRGAQERRAPSPRRVEDTTIGKGFGEFLKRGVAQAKPKEKEQRAEILPSKDGGFIATIQKGFEGIFGHLASSKEEVLRKRGPTVAPEYEAVPGDAIDQRVQYYARQLPRHLGDCLKIYRVSKGVYEIGTDEARLAWHASVNPNGSMLNEVFVFMTSKSDGKEDDEDHEGGQEMPSEPLPYFLRHSANVAYDLQFGSKVTKIPESSRLSFAEETGTLLQDGDADAKFEAMNVAVQQVKKREEAALEWRRQQHEEGGRGSPRKQHEEASGAFGGEASAGDLAAQPGGPEAPQGRQAQDPAEAARPAAGPVQGLQSEAPPAVARQATGGGPPQGLPQQPSLLSSLGAVGPLGPMKGLDPPQLKMPHMDLQQQLQQLQQQLPPQLPPQMPPQLQMQQPAWSRPEVPQLRPPAPPVLAGGQHRQMSRASLPAQRQPGRSGAAPLMR